MKYGVSSKHVLLGGQLEKNNFGQLPLVNSKATLREGQVEKKLWRHKDTSQPHIYMSWSASRVE